MTADLSVVTARSAFTTRYSADMTIADKLSAVTVWPRWSRRTESLLVIKHVDRDAPVEQIEAMAATRDSSESNSNQSRSIQLFGGLSGSAMSASRISSTMKRKSTTPIASPMCAERRVAPQRTRPSQTKRL